jgi:hypothetical protein
MASPLMCVTFFLIYPFFLFPQGIAASPLMCGPVEEEEEEEDEKEEKEEEEKDFYAFNDTVDR